MRRDCPPPPAPPPDIAVWLRDSEDYLRQVTGATVRTIILSLTGAPAAINWSLDAKLAEGQAGR